MKRIYTPRVMGSSAPKPASDIFAALANYHGLGDAPKKSRIDDSQFLKSFKQSSKLSCAPAFRSLTQAKAAKVMLAKIMPLLKKNSHMVYDVCVDSIRRHLKNNSVGLEKEILALAQDEIDWDALPQHSKVKWGKCPLLLSCKIDHRGTVRYQVNPLLVNELIKPYSYKVVDLTTHLSFRSNYALKLFEYANQYIEPDRGHGHSPFITEDKLRTLLNITPGRYSNTSSFIKYAIDEPLVEARGRGGINIICSSDQRTPRTRNYCVEGALVDSETAQAFKEVYEAKPRRQYWNALDMDIKMYLLAQYVFMHQMTEDQRLELRKDMCEREKGLPQEHLDLRSFTLCRDKEYPDERVSGDLLVEPLGIDESVIAELEGDSTWAPPKEIEMSRFGRGEVEI